MAYGKLDTENSLQLTFARVPPFFPLPFSCYPFHLFRAHAISKGGVYERRVAKCVQYVPSRAPY